MNTSVDVGNPSELIITDSDVVEGYIELNDAEISISDHHDSNDSSTFGTNKRKKTSSEWEDFDLVVNEPSTSKDETVSLSDGKYDHVRQREATAHWILMNEKPLNVVEEEGFTLMMTSNLPRFEEISCETVRADCISVYEIERKKLKDELKSIEKIYLSIDVWRSEVLMVSYMCVTAHFIDSDWELQKRVISFVALPPSHTGVDIYEAILKCMRDWEIEHKIFTISVDNATNNDVALQILKQTFAKTRKLFLGGKIFHVRCVANILNLIVQDGLGTLKNIIEKVRESVRFINHSEGRLKKFSQLVHSLQIPLRKLILDCQTRWNSTYEMLVAALRVKDAFSIYSMIEPTYLSCPTNDDWNKVEEVLKVLEVFYEASHVISGSDYPTSNLFLGVIWRVKEELDKKESHVEEYIRDMVKGMKEKFEKYWGECNLLMAIAAVLDPRYKMMLVDFSFSEIYPPNEAHANLRKVRDSLYELYDEYVVASNSSPKVNTSSTSDINEKSKKDKSILSRFDEYLNKLETLTLVKSELDIYLEEGVYRCKNGEDASKFDSIAWWKANEFKFKILSRMACDILAIPISTVALEATFSTGIRVLDLYRSSLSSDLIQVLICGGDWVRCRHGIKRQPKSHENEESVEVLLHNPLCST